MRTARALFVIAGALLASACREPSPLQGDAWRSRAIAYSGYRAGQNPDGPQPSREQVAEDLRILARNWGLLRVYSAGPHSEDVLEVIRSEKLGLKVMLGIWLAREPGAETVNARQIAEGIRLANAYEDVVVAVNVGNEVLIEWTAHPVPEERVIRYVRKVRARVTQPVTVADNYVWWRDYGAALAREVDFITMHSYPIWERRDIDEGLSFTVENYAGVRAAHPDLPIVIGEVGWSTFTEGNLHVPRAGDEGKQRRYYDEVTAWARKNGVPLFFFEAFDEPWKGTGTEGHWGLFTVDRKAKEAMRELYPELRTDRPTSPAYPERLAPVGPDLAVALNAGLAGEIRDGSVNVLGPGISASGVVPVEGAEGGTALRLAFTGESWGGVYFILGSHDASAARFVTMRLRLPDAVTTLELKLAAPETLARSVNLIGHPDGPDDGGWRRFRVPLSAFDGLDLSQVAVLGLWNPSDAAGTFAPCELVVDDLRFE